jgi:hypothetical protein
MAQKDGGTNIVLWVVGGLGCVVLLVIGIVVVGFMGAGFLFQRRLAGEVAAQEERMAREAAWQEEERLEAEQRALELEAQAAEERRRAEEERMRLLEGQQAPPNSDDPLQGLEGL